MPLAGKLTNNRKLLLRGGAVGSRPRGWQIWGLLEAVSWFRHRTFAVSSLIYGANVTNGQGLSQEFPGFVFFS